MAKILILGGTQWLGGTLARQALDGGHAVTCLARGASGAFPEGARSVVADRDAADAYAGVAGERWDLVVELTRFPAHARAAVEALSPAAEHWVFVSSCSVYASHARPGAAESDLLLPALESDAPYSDEKYGEAKVGCEWLTVASRGNAVLLVRPGLIGGPGDPSGRSTYWPLRFAAGRAPVLVPNDSGDQRYVQIVDVRDLAAFILEAGLAGRSGPVNAVGAEMPLGDVLASAASAAGYDGATASYPLAAMADDGVAPWAGPRSLPLVLPGGPDYAGFARRSDQRAVRWGLVRRPLAATFADIVGHESALDDGAPRAGLTAAEERELLARRG
ncbi:MAG: NAD-dependent epimerase/dehydratase family protein [Arthrobacter sp.]|uniref:NAD-dependent epimerase/dehydratase family protein n=1 Tax=Arthrobacter sp. TaxID=1667 RepID=UPI00348203BE